MKKFINVDLLLFSKVSLKQDFLNKDVLYKLFCDDYDFPVTTLIKLAELLGVEVGDLFVEESTNKMYLT